MLLRLRSLLAVLLLAWWGSDAQAQPAPGDPAGPWRIEGRQCGQLELTALGGGEYRYERRARARLDLPGRVERGTAWIEGGWLRTLEDPSQVGLTQRLGLRGGGEVRPWSGHYLLGRQTVPGLRTGAGAHGFERLVRPRPGERGGNRLTLLVDGQAFDDLRAHFRSARWSIDVQAYAWADDATGRGVAELLMARAREGVRVRCLIDAESRWVTGAVGVPDVTEGLHEELRAAGVQVIVQFGLGRSLRNGFRQLGRDLLSGLGRLFGKRPPRRERRGFNTHDHCKLFLVDESVAWIGGQNLAAANEHGWRGQQVRIEGPSVHDVLGLFVRHWNAAGGQATVPARPPEALGDLPGEVLVRTPGLGDPIRDRYLEEIAKARERVVLGTPQFGDPVIQRALVRAAARGVRVQVVVPLYEQDPQWVTREVLAQRQNALLAAGIELYGYEPLPYDVKAAAFDGKACLMGSAPLNGQRMDEVMLYVPDARFTRQLERQILGPDVERSRRLRPLRRTFWERVKSRIKGALNKAL